MRSDIELAEFAAELLSTDERFEVEPVRLSIVAFRHRTSSELATADAAKRDEALIEAILADGELMLSSTTLKGRSTLRFVVMNHRTTPADVKRSVKRVRELADGLVS